MLNNIWNDKTSNMCVRMFPKVLIFFKKANCFETKLFYLAWSRIELNIEGRFVKIMFLIKS